MSGWLTTEKIEVSAVDEDDTAKEKRRREVEQMFRGLRKVGKPLGIPDSQIQFTAEASPMLEDMIVGVQTIQEQLEFVAQEYGVTLDQFMQMRSAMNKFIKDLVITQSLEYNEKALNQFRTKFAITVNLVSSMKASKALLAQIVATSLGMKFQNLHDDDQAAMKKELNFIADALKQASKMNVSQAKKLMGELVGKVESVRNYLKEHARTSVKTLSPQEATPGKSEPFELSPDIKERLEEGVGTEKEASVIVYANMTESEALDLVKDINEIAQAMNEISEEMDSLFEYMPIFNQLAESLSRTVAIMEGAGAEAEESALAPEPSLAMASIQNEKEKTATKEER